MPEHEQGDPSPAVNRSSLSAVTAPTSSAGGGRVSSKQDGESTPANPSASANSSAPGNSHGSGGGGRGGPAVEGSSSPSLKKQLYQEQLRQTEAQLREKLRQLAFVTNTDNPIAKPPVVTDGKFTL